MGKKLILVITLSLIALLVGFSVTTAGDGGRLTGGALAKHQHEMGGPNQECTDCHNGIKADEPVPLKGKYANMGGSNHECTDCHNGIKAPVLPLPEGYVSCGDCH